MSGAPATSGVRHNTASMRQQESRPLGALLPTHLVILVLACVLWWIARDMVSVNRTLRDGAVVRFELEQELAGQWRIMPSEEEQRITLDVSGPTREINVFASELEANARRFGFQYRITALDVQRAMITPGGEAVIEPDASRLVKADDAWAPAELTVRARGADKPMSVRLERFVVRPAVVDLDSGVRGVIPGHTYQKIVQPDFAIEVFGPASLVNRIMEGDRAILDVGQVDVRSILENHAELAGTTPAAVLAQGRFVSIVPLVPATGVEIRRVGGARIAEVPVEFTIAVETNYERVTAELDVSAMLPAWTRGRRNVQLVGLPNTYPVELRVLRAQATQENMRKFVRLYVDLTAVAAPADATERRVRVTGVYYSLMVDPQFTIGPFDSQRVTLQNYAEIQGLEVTWDE